MRRRDSGAGKNALRKPRTEELPPLNQRIPAVLCQPDGTNSSRRLRVTDANATWFRSQVDIIPFQWECLFPDSQTRFRENCDQDGQPRRRKLFDTLYRANRITPIFMFLPWTCRLLGPHLRCELDAFWSAEPAVDLQYLAETNRFAKFIKQRIQRGIVSGAYVCEIVDYETSVMNLRFAGRTPGAEMRLVHFSNEPSALLSSLKRPEPIPESLPMGHYVVSLEVRGEILEVRTLTSSL